MKITQQQKSAKIGRPKILAKLTPHKKIKCHKSDHFSAHRVPLNVTLKFKGLKNWYILYSLSIHVNIPLSVHKYEILPVLLPIMRKKICTKKRRLQALVLQVLFTPLYEEEDGTAAAVAAGVPGIPAAVGDGSQQQARRDQQVRKYYMHYKLIC